MKKKTVHNILVILNILVVILFVWSIINYQYLDNQVSEAVKVGGIVFMVLLVIFLEGAPLFVGPSIAMASILSMKAYDPIFILILFLFSSVISNVIYFYLGYFAGDKIFKYFDKKDISSYKDLFKRYGRWTMIITAVSPLPYLPSLAGAFKMSPRIMFIETLFVRLFLHHLLVFLFWVFILN